MPYVQTKNSASQPYTTYIKTQNNASIVFYSNKTKLINDWNGANDIEYQIEKESLLIYPIVGDIKKEIDVRDVLYPNLSKGVGCPIIETVVSLTFKGDVRSTNLEDSHFSILVKDTNTLTVHFFRYNQTNSFRFNKKNNTTRIKAVMGQIPYYHEPVVYNQI